MSDKTVLAPGDDPQGPASRGMLSTAGINAHVAAELADITPPPTPEEQIDRNRNNPYGMYWIRGAKGLQLAAHAWFILQVSSTADDIFQDMHTELSKDPEATKTIERIASPLRDYIEERTALNEYAGKRKIKQEADDACYQLCQAAKFFIDATEKAKWMLDNGQDLDSNQQLSNLKALSQKAAREGYILMRAVTLASDEHVSLDCRQAARRVVEFSCRKLTEWFAQREQNTAQEGKLRNLGSAMELANFFKRSLTP